MILQCGECPGFSLTRCESRFRITEYPELEGSGISSWHGTGQPQAVPESAVHTLATLRQTRGHKRFPGQPGQCPATLWWQQAHSLSSLRLLISLKCEGAAHDCTLKLFGMQAQAFWKQCTFFLLNFDGDKFGYFFPFGAWSVLLLRHSGLKCSSASYLRASKRRKMACEMWEINPCHHICAIRDTCNSQMQ